MIGYLTRIDFKTNTVITTFMAETRSFAFDAKRGFPLLGARRWRLRTLTINSRNSWLTYVLSSTPVSRMMPR